jgi:hypothetical protein
LLEPIVARFQAARAGAIVHPSLTGAKILARAFVVACMGDDPRGKVVRAHPLCVYPAVAKWTGKGSSDDPTNFVCADP